MTNVIDGKFPSKTPPEDSAEIIKAADGGIILTVKDDRVSVEVFGFDEPLSYLDLLRFGSNAVFNLLDEGVFDGG
jgi:hypothetical protein